MVNLLTSHRKTIYKLMFTAGRWLPFVVVKNFCERPPTYDVSDKEWEPADDEDAHDRAEGLGGLRLLGEACHLAGDPASGLLLGRQA